MSIFGIIGLCFLIGFVVFVIGRLIVHEGIEERFIFIPIILGVIVWIGGTFMGIGYTTENERVYVEKYKAQKATIEMSLANEDLTGLERVQLVTQATELNGEFAKRKSTFDKWHYVVYDNTIYDGVELIDLTRK